MTLLATYSRRYCPWVMLLLLGGIIFALILAVVEENLKITSIPILIACMFWILLLINAFFFATNGYILYRGFKRTVEQISKSEMPVDSLEGFSETQSNIGLMFQSAYS